MRIILPNFGTNSTLWRDSVTLNISSCLDSSLAGCCGESRQIRPACVPRRGQNCIHMPSVTQPVAPHRAAATSPFLSPLSSPRLALVSARVEIHRSRHLRADTSLLRIYSFSTDNDTKSEISMHPQNASRSSSSNR